jgi:hypothetical protein
MRFLASSLDFDHSEHEIGGDQRFAKLLFDFIKMTNVGIKSKIQERINMKSSDDSKLAQMIVDQTLMVKNIAALLNN